MKYGHLPSPSQVNRRINAMSNSKVHLFRSEKPIGPSSRRRWFPKGWIPPKSIQGMGRISHQNIKRVASFLRRYYQNYRRWPNRSVRSWMKDNDFRRAMRLAKRMMKI